MSDVRGRKGGKRRKASSASQRVRRQSRTWEEHSLRAKAAISLSTRRFIRENREGIDESTQEEVASNSYVAGMLDMLSIARGAFGFWGADQILDELERYNRRRSLGREGLRACPGPEGPGGDGPLPEGEPQGPQSGTGGDVGPRRGRARDPMFA
jgi:hypothetical protein